MAGEAVLAAFMQVLFDKIITTVLDETRSLWGAHGELQNMTTTLPTIQALLEDAEEKQLKDRSVRYWLVKLKDVAYDMDELLDKYTAEVLKRKMEREAQSMQVCSCFANICWHGLLQFKLRNRIRAIRERFDKIARERESLGLQILDRTNQLQVTERPQTSSLVDDINVVGRETDKEKIIKILLADAGSTPNVSVLPIVGMGGLGKTTLAQLVYNDHRVKEHFQLRIWVCVSEIFDEMKLTKETLESTTSGYSCTTRNLNLLHEELVEKFKGKRFLLVLDDVWNEDPNKWYTYSNALRSGNRGSKIIVTTQNESVGRIMGGVSPYKLKQLSDSECWTVFRNYAFLNGNSRIYPNLEKIGRDIVQKLEGLPLGAKTLGSLLYSKTNEEDWKNILKSEIWELTPGKNNILPALRLSYKHLTPHLKQCFAFCSVFHKDYIFERSILVKIWMALGFIQPQGSKRLEDIGNSYFDELVTRSFFQSHNGNYVMHDAIHKLAQSLSIGECHKMEEDLQNNDQQKLHHLSFSCANSVPTSFVEFYKFKRLRTLLLLQGYKSKTGPIPDDLFTELSSLRVLVLHRRDINKLPNSVGNLIQLRYLGLSGTDIKTLPQSIGKLYNLQVLNLKNCNLLVKIPDCITRLINLRHLEATTKLITKITGLGNLTCLQDLKKFTVRKAKGHKIKELKEMNELRGNLRIKKLENVFSGKQASEANLYAKEFLHTLSLEWSDERSVNCEGENLHEEVLEALQPHHDLKELTITGYAGTKFPSWLGSPSFCYLQTIHMSNCRRCIVLPPLGQLPLLRYLDISGVHGLIRISEEFSGNADIQGFPSLVELLLDDMLDLVEWICSDYVSLFPCLTEVEIVDCPKLRELPSLPRTVTRLKISDIGINFLPGLQNSDSLHWSRLSALHINECVNLASLQQGLLEQQLRALEQLTITGCQELAKLPTEGFRSLVSLKSLHIYNCPKLGTQEDDRALLPSSLEDLSISSCSKLVKKLLEELKHLSYLQHLKIKECPDLYYFPEEGLPITLKFIGISDCINLQLLPARIQELSSLTTLTIVNCQQVQYLPEAGLPIELQELCIKECPLLKERCQERSGEDWHKIVHIPRIEIDELILRRLG